MEKEGKRIIEIYQSGKAQIEVKKSRFIADCFSIKNEQEAVIQLERLRKEHYNARHICYAYRLEGTPDIARCSDDGEPSQTAGKPILEVLEKEDLYNAMICVTRYFGGTLLGTGGLSRAYRQAAQESVRAADVMQCLKGMKGSIQVDYTLLGKIENLFHSQGIDVLQSEYNEKVTLQCLIPSEKEQQIKKALRDLSNGSLMLENETMCKYAVSDGKHLVL